MPSYLRNEYRVAYTRFHQTWAKLQFYRFEQYDRIVAIDADILIVDNLDELMDIEVPKNAIASVHACMCNFWRFPETPKDWTPKVCAYTYQTYPESKKKALPPIFPNSLNVPSLSGGMIVYRPSEEHYTRLIQHLDTSPTDAFLFADQSLLSQVYRGEWTALPYIYNFTQSMRGAHPDVCKDDGMKLFHYGPKPWIESRSKTEAYAKDDCHGWWWDMDGERRESERQVGIVEPDWESLKWKRLVEAMDTQGHD